MGPRASSQGETEARIEVWSAGWLGQGLATSPQWLLHRPQKPPLPQGSLVGTEGRRRKEASPTPPSCTPNTLLAGLAHVLH